MKRSTLWIVLSTFLIACGPTLAEHSFTSSGGEHAAAAALVGMDGAGAASTPAVQIQDLQDISGGSAAFPFDQWLPNAPTSQWPVLYYTQLGQTAPGEATIVVTVSNKQYVLQARVPGTTGGLEPTWDITTGHTTRDGTVTWIALGPGVSCDFSRYQLCYSENPSTTQALVLPYANPLVSGVTVTLMVPGTSGSGHFIFPSPLFSGIPLGSHAQWGSYVPGMKFLWNGSTYGMNEAVAATDWGSTASGTSTVALTAGMWNAVGGASVTVPGEFVPHNGRYSTDYLCTVFVTNTGTIQAAFNVRITDSGATQVEQDGISIAPGATVEAVLPYIAASRYVLGSGSAGASCFIEPALGSTLVLAQYQGNFPSSIIAGGLLPAWAE